MKTTRSALLALVLLVSQAVPVAAAGGLFSINPGLSVWTVVVFLTLLAGLWRFAWGPIMGALESREDRIQGQLDDAAAAQTDAKALLVEQRAEMNEARRGAQRMIQEAKESAEVVRRQVEEKAREEGQRFVEAARGEIERERDAALDLIRKESVELALAATAKLLSEKLDTGRDRELIEGYITQLRSDGGSGAQA